MFRHAALSNPAFRPEAQQFSPCLTQIPHKIRPLPAPGTASSKYGSCQAMSSSSGFSVISTSVCHSDPARTAQPSAASRLTDAAYPCGCTGEESRIQWLILLWKGVLGGELSRGGKRDRSGAHRTVGPPRPSFEGRVIRKMLN